MPQHAFSTGVVSAHVSCWQQHCIQSINSVSVFWRAAPAANPEEIDLAEDDADSAVAATNPEEIDLDDVVSEGDDAAAAADEVLCAVHILLCGLCTRCKSLMHTCLQRRVLRWANVYLAVA